MVSVRRRCRLAVERLGAALLILALLLAYVLA